MPTIYVTELQHKQLVSPEEWQDYLKQKRAQRGKGGDMDYEYVALTWHQSDRMTDKEFRMEYHRLCRAGWGIAIDAYFPDQTLGGACILRRPKDEPRKWTEGAIKAIFAGWEEKTIRCQELQERNEELQAAIDEMVAVRKVNAAAGTAGEIQELTILAVERLLHPLATKEETNG